MAETARGIWYPGGSDDLTPLESRLATMASSMNDALDDLDTEFSSGFPEISIQDTGSDQAIPDSAVTYLNGGGSGWAASVNTAAGNMSLTAGQNTTPITIIQAGLYAISFEYHMNIQSTGRAFCEINITGGTSRVLRTSMAFDDTCAGTVILSIAAASEIGLDVYFTRTDGFDAVATLVKMSVYKIK